MIAFTDDMISTGGTLLALIEAIKKTEADIVDIICVAEKVDYSGVGRVFDSTGYEVKSLLKVSVSGERSKVL
jgi:adenine/guanine phosphoribosyltransferase-like PRPP-binding protein